MWTGIRIFREVDCKAPRARTVESKSNSRRFAVPGAVLGEVPLPRWKSRSRSWVLARGWYRRRVRSIGANRLHGFGQGELQQSNWFAAWYPVGPRRWKTFFRLSGACFPSWWNYQSLAEHGWPRRLRAPQAVEDCDGHVWWPNPFPQALLHLPQACWPSWLPKGSLIMRPMQNVTVTGKWSNLRGEGLLALESPSLGPKKVFWHPSELLGRFSHILASSTAIWPAQQQSQIDLCICWSFGWARRWALGYPFCSSTKPLERDSSFHGLQRHRASRLRDGIWWEDAWNVPPECSLAWAI